MIGILQRSRFINSFHCKLLFHIAANKTLLCMKILYVLQPSLIFICNLARVHPPSCFNLNIKLFHSFTNSSRKVILAFFLLLCKVVQFLPTPPYYATPTLQSRYNSSIFMEKLFSIKMVIETLNFRVGVEKTMPDLI